MKETKFKDTEVGRIPEDWEVISLGDVGEVRMCKRIMKYQTSPEGVIPFYKIGTFGKQADTFIPLELYTEFKANYNYPKKGDILLSAAGTIGRTVVFDGMPSYFQDSNIVWIENNERLLSNALLYYIYKNLNWVTESGTIPRIYNSIVTSIKFSIPLNKDEQHRIVSALTRIDNLISSLNKLIEKKRAIKQGAMQQLLTGKKRLKGFNEPWVEKKLGKLCNLFGRIGYRGYTKADLVQQGEGAISFSPSDIILDKINYDTCTYISAYKYEESPEIKVYNGDIIFCKTASIGKCALVENLKEKATINPQFVVMKNFICNNKYLYYRLIDVNFQNKVKEIAGGSTIPTMSQEKLKELILSMPSDIVEQTAIAEILSDMDKEIANLEVKKSKYEKIKQGMMQQLLTGRIRLVETDVKTNTTSANVYFRRSVLAAEIAERLYEEPTFGHVKMEKMLFLTERLCHIDIDSHYHRDAAGPYDNKALRSIDSQLKKQKWFEVQRTEKGYRYVPMQNRGKHKTYFNRYYSGAVSMFDKIINTFKTQNTERCEIVATLYSAWEDLLHSNKSFTDTDIVNEVLNNWHESKKRISQDRWFKAIQWMRNNGFAPYNNNK